MIRVGPPLLALIAVLACDTDKPVASDQAAAEDSALALEVMTARGDTLTAPYIEPIPEAPPPAATRSVAESPPKREAPAPRPTVITRPPIAPEIAVAVATVKEKPAPKKVVRESPAEARVVGLVAKGSALTLVTSSTVCLDDADAIGARVVSSVRGSNGVVIPAGAHATAHITSKSEWGAGIGLKVTSVRFNGRSYPVSSKVGYVIPVSARGGACIPGGTHLDAEIAEPVRILAMN